MEDSACVKIFYFYSLDFVDCIVIIKRSDILHGQALFREVKQLRRCLLMLNNFEKFSFPSIEKRWTKDKETEGKKEEKKEKKKGGYVKESLFIKTHTASQGEGPLRVRPPKGADSAAVPEVLRAAGKFTFRFEIR